MAFKIIQPGEFRIEKRQWSDLQGRQHSAADVCIGGFALESEDGLSRQEMASGEGLAHFTVTPEDGETLDEAVDRFLAHEHWPGLTLHDLREAALPDD